MGAADYSPTVSNGAFNAAFKAIANDLDAFNERRERIVKASRDVTYLSKKAIFALHRVKESNRGLTLETGSKNLAAIREIISTRIASEMSADLYPRLHRAFSPGMQEYVEAAVFHAYLRDGALVSRETLSEEVAQTCASNGPECFKMHVEGSDYVLGVSDATGELMRLAVASGGQGNGTVSFAVRDFLGMMVESFEGLKLPGYAGRDLSFKMSVMRQSCEKVETVCFDLTMRRAEFGEKAIPMEVAVAASTAASGVERGPCDTGGNRHQGANMGTGGRGGRDGRGGGGGRGGRGGSAPQGESFSKRSDTEGAAAEGTLKRFRAM